MQDQQLENIVKRKDRGRGEIDTKSKETQQTRSINHKEANKGKIVTKEDLPKPLSVFPPRRYTNVAIFSIHIAN